MRQRLPSRMNSSKEERGMAKMRRKYLFSKNPSTTLGTRGQAPTASGTNEGRDGGSGGRGRRQWAASEVGETDDAPST